MKGLEGFPKASEEVSSLSEEELDQKAQEMMMWAANSFKLWNTLSEGGEPDLPTDPEEAASYIEKFDYLKENNREKYPGEEGKAFYKRVDRYIEKLKTVV